MIDSEILDRIDTIRQSALAELLRDCGTLAEPARERLYHLVCDAPETVESLT